MARHDSNKQGNATELTDADLAQIAGGGLFGTVGNAVGRLVSGETVSNFEIQDLMSRYNQAETLASSVQKKTDDTSNGIIGKVG